MVSAQLNSIRNQTSQLNVSKGGSTALYVDQTHPAASDKNDGFSWDRPKLTIMGAIADSIWCLFKYSKIDEVSVKTWVCIF